MRAAVALVTVAFFAPVATGCVSNEYVIPSDELGRLAQTPPGQRGERVHVVQGIGERRADALVFQEAPVDASQPDGSNVQLDLDGRIDLGSSERSTGSSGSGRPGGWRGGGGDRNTSTGWRGSPSGSSGWHGSPGGSGERQQLAGIAVGLVGLAARARSERPEGDMAAVEVAVGLVATSEKRRSCWWCSWWQSRSWPPWASWPAKEPGSTASSRSHPSSPSTCATDGGRVDRGARRSTPADVAGTVEAK